MMYFIFTDDFLSSGMLRNSRAVSWYTPSNDYSFEIELGHPFLSFNKEFDLSCSAKGSSIYVYGTKGKYWPLSYKWEGKGGKGLQGKAPDKSDVLVLFESLLQ